VFYNTLNVVNWSKDLKIILNLKNIITQAHNYILVFLVSKKARIVLTLKNIIAQVPNCCISRFVMSKKVRILKVYSQVVTFKRYSSFLEEFVGPLCDHPWFKMTRETIAIDYKERW
jgi:hypothetical protein